MKTFEEYKDIQSKNETLKFKGFTSTSLKKEEALRPISNGLNKDGVPVLYQINNLSEDSFGAFNYFKLDNSEYTLFPNE